MPHQNDSFAFLENSTAQALLGTASATSAASLGPGFLSAALAVAPSAPQLIGESLRKLSIGNTLADAFGAGQRESPDSPADSIPLSQVPTQQLRSEFVSLQADMFEGKEFDQERMRKIGVILRERPDRFEGGDRIENEQPPAEGGFRNPFGIVDEALRGSSPR